jgi:hypothetical protein
MYPDQPNNPNPIVQGNFSETPVADVPQGKDGHKKITILVAIVIVVIALLGGGYYLLNKSLNSPDKLWTSALNNSNTVATAIINYMGSPATNGYDIKSTFETNRAGTVTSDTKGTTTGSTNSQASNYTTKFPVQGSPITLDTISNTPDGASSPDFYYRISGLSGLSQIFQKNNASTNFTDSAGAVEGTWFLLNHADPASTSIAMQLDQNLPQPKTEISTIGSKLNALNQAYILGGDPATAVLTGRSNVGQTTIDKRSVYHYKFNFEVDHYNKFVSAVGAVVGSDSQTMKSLQKQLGLDNLNTIISSVKGNPVADVYVDKNTKTISTIHLPVGSGGDNYVEIGFKGYDGGSKYPFYVNEHASANNVTTVNNYSLNVETNAGFNYTYSENNKDSQGTIISTGTTTLLPRKTSLVISLPTQTSDFQANSTALNNVFSGLFPDTKN